MGHIEIFLRDGVTPVSYTHLDVYKRQELDQSLKSQPVEEQILLETALCRLAMAGSGR